MKSIFKKINSAGLMICLVCLATISDPLLAQWVKISGPFGGLVSSLAVVPNGIGGTNLFAGTPSGVYISANNGTTFTAASTGLAYNNVNTMAVSGTDLFAATFIGGVYRSVNNGGNWNSASSGLPLYTYITALAVSSEVPKSKTVYAGTKTGSQSGDVYSLFLSADNGVNWSEAKTGLTNTSVSAIISSGTDLYAGTYGVFRSTSNGANWNTASNGLPVGAFVNAFTVSPNGGASTHLFAGTSNNGVYRSIDNGANWIQVNTGLISTSVTALASSGSSLFAGTSGGVFLSADNGAHWSAVNTGLPGNATVLALTVSGTNLIAGTNGSGAWMRPLSELITSVESISSGQTVQFTLEQNYPNPFNPATNIGYAIPANGPATLKIFNMLGQEIAELINDEVQTAGYHQIGFDGSQLGSGMYFYQLRAGMLTVTKRMMLVK